MSETSNDRDVKKKASGVFLRDLGSYEANKTEGSSSWTDEEKGRGQLDETRN